MSKRTSTRGKGLKKKSSFLEAVDEAARLTVKIRTLEARRDKRIQTVRESSKEALSPLTDERDRLLGLAEDYALENRDELFSDGSKSSASALATFGFQMGQPTLKTLNRKWTWKKITQGVKELFGARFLRVKEELDKEALKSAYKDAPAKLADLGCRIEQKEAFWIEPKDKEETL